MRRPVGARPAPYLTRTRPRTCAPYLRPVPRAPYPRPTLLAPYLHTSSRNFTPGPYLHPPPPLFGLGCDARRLVRSRWRMLARRLPARATHGRRAHDRALPRIGPRSGCGTEGTGGCLQVAPREAPRRFDARRLGAAEPRRPSSTRCSTAVGTDKLMLVEGNKWLYKNKEHGMMSAAASLGMLLLWDVDGGLTQIEFLYSITTTSRRAPSSPSACCRGTRNECDPALALLTEYAEDKHPNNVKMGALFGLGLAVRAEKEEVLEALMPVVSNDEAPLDVADGVALVGPRLLGLVQRRDRTGADDRAHGAAAGHAVQGLDDAANHARRRPALSGQAAGGRGGARARQVPRRRPGRVLLPHARDVRLRRQRQRPQGAKIHADLRRARAR